MSGMASGGHRFRLLPPKEIVSVLNRLGVHPQATSEAVDKPTAEAAAAFMAALVAFSYDLEPQQVKAQLPAALQKLGLAHPEIYGEAVDAVTVFKLARQLALINLLDDFSLKDLWEPQAKRFRTLLSAAINCCRYKENKLSIIDSLKEELHEFDAQRLDLVARAGELERQLRAAEAQHGQELQATREAEAEVQQATDEVEKLQRQKACAERVAEEAEAGLAEQRSRRQAQEDETERLRAHVAELREQVSESPEGIEREIEEQRAVIQQHRTTLEGLSNERRSRLQRDQALGRLAEQVGAVHELLLSLGEAAETSAEVAEQRSVLRQDASELRREAEAQEAELRDLQERLRQMSLDQDRDKLAHEGRVRELAVRRQQAFEQHQQLQAQRGEEQRREHALQLQRGELEAEVANAQRAFELQMAELRSKQSLIQYKTEEYTRQLLALCKECDQRRAAAAARAVSSSPPPVAKAVSEKMAGRTLPQALAARLLACSPSPARSSSGTLAPTSPLA